jgi:lipopolysaccharide transport system ATP-binding protein
MPEPLAISLRDVSKTYRLYDGKVQQALSAFGLEWLRFWRRPQHREYEALRGVSLEIRRGERVGIVGRNGAGKTTLLKLITGNFTPTGGRLDVRGSVQALMSVGIGFHPEFTGYENIRSSLIFSGLPPDQLDEPIREIVDFVELGGFLDQPLKTYSLGMQARLMFATATAVRPEILIIDEVLGAGDAYFSAKSAARMERLTASGCTVLLVSHSMQQILKHCTRALWLEQGQVVMDGAALEVVQSYEVAMQRRVAEANAKSSAQVAASDVVHKEWVRGAGDSDSTVGKAGGKEFSVTLSDGARVYRWPSDEGVKVDSLEILCDGEPRTLARALADVALRLGLHIERDGRFRLRYVFSLHTLDGGRRVARFYSPPDEFDGKAGERREARANLAPLLLGPGEFLLSIAVLDDAFPRDALATRRYDLLSKSFVLRIAPADEFEQPYYHQPSIWSFAGPHSEQTVR